MSSLLNSNSEMGIPPKGQVPALALDNGQTLTEAGRSYSIWRTRNRNWGSRHETGRSNATELQEWLNFITSELHKSFGTLFQPAVPDECERIAKETISKRFRSGRPAPW
jgi:glutathione S-transferase